MYIKLWMGTHPKAPSIKEGTTQNLKDIILTNANQLLTPGVANKFNKDLPFLFKVLSISKALSIQAHPDKTLAEQLYQDHPDIYKDDNHKPEMAIALTPFEGLCGFRIIPEIVENLHYYPELSNVIGKVAVDEFLSAVEMAGGSKAGNEVAKVKEVKTALRNLYQSLMVQNSSVVEEQLEKLINRIKSSHPNPPKGSLEEILLRIESQYPGDIGNFSILLLNYISMVPGEGLYLAANEPHAYISGDCIECMATSDNVVRAGLTPKYKDVNTLVSMLTYNCKSTDDQILKGKPYLNSKTTTLYDPPIEEFSILCTKLSSSQKMESFAGMKGPSIIIVTKNNGRIITDERIFDASQGSVFFIGANSKITLEAVDSDEVTFYRAFCILSSNKL